jgi:hypothetical protein
MHHRWWWGPSCPCCGPAGHSVPAVEQWRVGNHLYGHLGCMVGCGVDMHRMVLGSHGHHNNPRVEVDHDRQHPYAQREVSHDRYIISPSPGCTSSTRHYHGCSCASILVELGGKAHHTQVDGDVAFVVCGIVVINACQKGGDYISIGRVEYRVQDVVLQVRLL